MHPVWHFVNGIPTTNRVNVRQSLTIGSGTGPYTGNVNALTVISGTDTPTFFSMTNAATDLTAGWINLEANNPAIGNNVFTGVSFTGYRVSPENFAVAYASIYGVMVDQTAVSGALSFVVRDTNTSVERMRLAASGTLQVDSTITTGGGVLSQSASAGVGYATGAGGVVTQETNKATAVTLDKTTGQITMNGAALNAATRVTFQVNNAQVAATDAVVVSLVGGEATTGSYSYWVNTITGGSFRITLKNETGGALSEAVVLKFAVLKSVNA
jgi:hypothetical protein